MKMLRIISSELCSDSIVRLNGEKSIRAVAFDVAVCNVVAMATPAQTQHTSIAVWRPYQQTGFNIVNILVFLPNV